MTHSVMPSFCPQGTIAVSKTAEAKSDSDASTYTFSAQALGAAESTRRIIVIAAGRANASRSISSVTVDGIAATALATGNATGAGADICAAYQALVPSNATGDVVVTFDNTMLRAFITVLRVTGWPSGTAYATATDIVLSGNDLNASISCPARGAIVGGVEWLTSAGSGTNTWTNLTESSDQTSVESSASGSSAAFDAFSTAQSSRSITATCGGTASQGALVLVALSP